MLKKSSVKNASHISFVVHVHEFKLSNVQKSLVGGIKVVVADADAVM